MQKSYLLLRHNQQSGPYSLEELVGMSLQAKDLVWIIGQSAGWRYPEEIEALKTFVQGPQAPVKAAMPAEPRQAQPSLPQKPQEPASKEQPSRHIYVCLPASAVVVTQPAVTESATSLSFEERVEKMRQRVTAVDIQKIPPDEEDVETKYSRSLEDIKAEYASWMQTQKHKRSRKLSLRPVLTIAVVIVAAIGVFWMGNQLFSRSTDKPIVNNTSVPSGEDFYPTVVMPPVPVTSAKAANKEKNEVRRKEDDVIGKAVVVEKRVVPQRDTQESQLIANRPTESVVKADEPTREDSSKTTAEMQATVAEQLHINAEYIAGSKRSSGVDGLVVTVKNNSNQMMKVVAVNVIYFTDGMAELDRKTLYFSNLHPGQALTRNAPPHKKAEGAYAQLGLISSEEGNIFYASNR